MLNIEHWTFGFKKIVGKTGNQIYSLKWGWGEEERGKNVKYKTPLLSLWYDVSTASSASLVLCGHY